MNSWPISFWEKWIQLVGRMGSVGGPQVGQPWSNKWANSNITAGLLGQWYGNFSFVKMSLLNTVYSVQGSQIRRSCCKPHNAVSSEQKNCGQITSHFRKFLEAVFKKRATFQCSLADYWEWVTFRQHRWQNQVHLAHFHSFIISIKTACKDGIRTRYNMSKLNTVCAKQSTRIRIMRLPLNHPVHSPLQATTQQRLDWYEGPLSPFTWDRLKATLLCIFMLPWPL